MYKVIFDADGIVYRVGFALEDVDSEHVVRKRVKEYIDFHMSDITRTFGKVSQTPTIVLSAPGESNFRFKLAVTQPYKGNRTSPKPKHYELIRQILSESESFMQLEGQEADDTIADLTAEDPEHTVIVSQDKDLLQNPGWYYIPGGAYMDYVEDEEGEMHYMEITSPKRPVFYVDGNTSGSLHLEMHTGGKKVLFGTGKIWHYAQMLLGDPADNIPGVKGYGAVKIYEMYQHYKKDLEHFDIRQDTWAEIVRGVYCGEPERFHEIYTLLKIGGHKK
jgi:5'-3' exonuclease